MLHPKCDITTLVKLAVEDAKIASARDVSEACGNVMVEEMQVEYAGDMNIFMPMIPEHLYLVTTEIVANGLRANAERHGPKLGKSRRTLPPVRVTLSCAVCVCVCVCVCVYIYIYIHTYQYIGAGDTELRARAFLPPDFRRGRGHCV